MPPNARKLSILFLIALMGLVWALITSGALSADRPAAVAAVQVARNPAAPVQPVPQSQISIPCVVTEVYDGDTITVRVTLDMRIRLLDCWAPEVRTKDAAEKVKGLASRDHLRSICPGGSAAQLLIPLTGERFDDVITMGRVLGYVSVDGKDLSAQQVAAGHATKDKTSQ